MAIVLTKGSNNAWMSPQTMNGVPRAVFGRQPLVQGFFTERPMISEPARSVFRFVGPSGFPKDDKTAYKERVTGILNEVKTGLEPVKDRVEISTGVSKVGLDAMLSDTFYGSGIHISGVVSWGLPKLTLFSANSDPVVLSVGDDWSGYDDKMIGVNTIFRGLQTLVVEGNMPEEGILVQEPELTLDGRNVSGLLVERNDGTDFANMDRLAIYGNDWDRAYDINRPYLSGVVVLGGGPICRMEAIASFENLGAALCIAKQLLPENHNLGKKNEMPSASVYLTQPEFGFKLPEYNVQQIIDRITEIVNTPQEVVSVRMRFPSSVPGK